MFSVSDGPRQWPDPDVASRGFSPRRVLPLSHAGPPPPPPPQNVYHHRQIHASRPPSQRFHGVRPPAVPTVTMRAPAASSGGTSEDLQQIPCHSIPHPPPEAVPPCPSCISGPCIPPRVFCRPSPDVSTALDKVSIRVDMRFSGPRREKPLLPFRQVSVPLDTLDLKSHPLYLFSVHGARDVSPRGKGGGFAKAVRLDVSEATRRSSLPRTWGVIQSQKGLRSLASEIVQLHPFPASRAGAPFRFRDTNETRM